jgi:hypothetical protein
MPCFVFCYVWDDLLISFERACLWLDFTVVEFSLFLFLLFAKVLEF